MELSDYIDLQECPLLQTKFYRALVADGLDVDALGLSRDEEGQLIVHCRNPLNNVVVLIPMAFDQFAERYELITQ